MASTKIAIVTGGNKGIGYAIVKGLCEKYDGTVYLTARDVGRGEEAVKKLKALGLNPSFHQLDINDQTSIDNFKQYIEKTHGGIDLLVNNAAIAYPPVKNDTYAKDAEFVLNINYVSLTKVCDALFPLMRKNGRVINVSSMAGLLSRIPSEDIRKRIGDPNVTRAQLDALLQEYFKALREDKYKTTWGTSYYKVSKILVNALTGYQQKKLDAETPNRNLTIVAVHPGYVDTDLTKHTGILKIEEGARPILYACLNTTKDFKGKFVWCDGEIVDWKVDMAHEPKDAACGNVPNTNFNYA